MQEPKPTLFQRLMARAWWIMAGGCIERISRQKVAHTSHTFELLMSKCSTLKGTFRQRCWCVLDNRCNAADPFDYAYHIVSLCALYCTERMYHKDLKRYDECSANWRKKVGEKSLRCGDLCSFLAAVLYQSPRRDGSFCYHLYDSWVEHSCEPVWFQRNSRERSCWSFLTVRTAEGQHAATEYVWEDLEICLEPLKLNWSFSPKLTQPKKHMRKSTSSNPIYTESSHKLRSFNTTTPQIAPRWADFAPGLGSIPRSWEATTTRSMQGSTTAARCWRVEAGRFQIRNRPKHVQTVLKPQWSTWWCDNYDSIMIYIIWYYMYCLLCRITNI